MSSEVTPEIAPDVEVKKDETGITEAEDALRDLKEMGVDIAHTPEEAQENGGFTLDELRRVVSNLEKIEAVSDNALVRGQWARHNNKYLMVGNTIPKLPPGYYDNSVDSSGNLYFDPIRARTDDLLRFPDAATDKIIAEIETFWEREDVFRKFGLPYKRGILMWGPPGSGKTSTLQLLARDVVDRGGMMLIYQPELFIHAYRQLRQVQPETPLVVVMEDLDAILQRHSESQVLNTLDGADVIDRTVFVATTNYPENLGPRIVNRPSRFDRRLFVGDPSAQARTIYLESLVKKQGLPKGLDLRQMVKDTDTMSLAHVKELFVATVVIGTPYEEALGHLKEQHLNDPHSAQDRDKYHVLEREGQYI